MTRCARSRRPARLELDFAKTGGAGQLVDQLQADLRIDQVRAIVPAPATRGRRLEPEFAKTGGAGQLVDQLQADLRIDQVRAIAPAPGDVRPRDT